MDINTDKKIVSQNTPNISVKNNFLTDSNFLDEINELKDTLNPENTASSNTDEIQPAESLLTSVVNEFQVKNNNNFKIIKTTKSETKINDDIKPENSKEIDNSSSEIAANPTLEEPEILKQVQNDRFEQKIEITTSDTSGESVVIPQAEALIDKKIEVTQPVNDDIKQEEIVSKSFEKDILPTENKQTDISENTSISEDPKILKQVQCDRDKQKIEMKVSVIENDSVEVQHSEVLTDKKIESTQHVNDNTKQEEIVVKSFKTDILPTENKQTDVPENTSIQEEPEILKQAQDGRNNTDIEQIQTNSISHNTDKIEEITSIIKQNTLDINNNIDFSVAIQSQDETTRTSEVRMHKDIEVKQTVNDSINQEEIVLKSIETDILPTENKQTDVSKNTSIQEELKLLKQVQNDSGKQEIDKNIPVTAKDEEVKQSEIQINRDIEIKSAIKDEIKQDVIASDSEANTPLEEVNITDTVITDKPVLEEPKLLKQVQNDDAKIYKSEVSEMNLPKEETLNPNENQRFSHNDMGKSEADESIITHEPQISQKIMNNTPVNEKNETIKQPEVQLDREIETKPVVQDEIKQDVIASDSEAIQTLEEVNITDTVITDKPVQEEPKILKQVQNNISKQDIEMNVPVTAKNEAVKQTEVQMDREMDVKPVIQNEIKQDGITIDIDASQPLEEANITDTVITDKPAPEETKILKQVHDDRADVEPQKEINENILQKEDNTPHAINMTVKPAVKRNEKEEAVSENNIINTQPIKEEIKPQVQTNLSFGTGQESFESVLGKTNDIKESDKELEEDLAILSTDEENRAMAAANNVTVSQIETNNNAQKITQQNLKLASGVDPISQLIADTNKQMQISRKILEKAETKTNFKPNNEVTYSEVITEVEEIVSDNKPVAEVKKETHIEHKTVTKEKVVKVKPEIMPQKDVSFMLSLTKTDSINLADTLLNQTQETAQNPNISNKLIELIKKAMSENKPLRLDFDNKISVIIKISKEGKISADFIPGDKAVENYLRNNIPLLKQQFEAQNIKYDDITHQNSKQQRDKDNTKNKKEQKNE